MNNRTNAALGRRLRVSTPTFAGVSKRLPSRQKRPATGAILFPKRDIAAAGIPLDGREQQAEPSTNAPVSNWYPHRDAGTCVMAPGLRRAGRSTPRGLLAYVVVILALTIAESAYETTSLLFGQYPKRPSRYEKAVLVGHGAGSGKRRRLPSPN